MGAPSSRHVSGTWTALPFVQNNLTEHTRADRGKRLLAGGGHAYFGRHFACGVLGARTHPYACVDKDRVPSCLRQTRDGRPGEREAMPGRDKDWEGALGRPLRAHALPDVLVQ